MNILLDVIILAVLILCVIRGFHKTILGSVATIGVVVLSLACSWLLSQPVSKLTAKLVEPSMASMAGGELASLVGVPALDNGYDTMTAVTPEDIFSADPEGLALIAEKYQVETDTLRQTFTDASAQENASNAVVSQAILTALIAPITFATSRAISFLLLYFILYVILRALCRLFFAAQLKTPNRRKFTPIPTLLGAVVGVLLVSFLLTPFINLLQPYHAGLFHTLDLSVACEKSVFFGLFAKLNFFNL